MTHTLKVAESDVLDYVRWLLHQPGVYHEERLSVLKQCADIKLERPSNWSLSRIRTEMAAMVATFHRPDQCFICRCRGYRLYWHHIIQVQHGGSNVPQNFVAVCHKCHQRIHPWLPEPTSLEEIGAPIHIADALRKMLRRGWRP